MAQWDSRRIRWQSWPMVILCIPNSGLPLPISDSRIRRMMINNYTFRLFEPDHPVLPPSPYLTLAQRQGLLPITTSILPFTARLILSQPRRVLSDTRNHQAQLLRHLPQASRNPGLVTGLAPVAAPALERTLCMRQRLLTVRCQIFHLFSPSYLAHGLHRPVQYHPTQRPQ
jgi:hypothetical protein